MKRMVLLIFISLLVNEFNFCQNTGIGISASLRKQHIYSGSSRTPGQIGVNTTSISDPVIDNNLYGYEITVFSPFGTWDDGLVLYAIKIEYTISEAE